MADRQREPVTSTRIWQTLQEALELVGSIQINRSLIPWFKERLIVAQKTARERNVLIEKMALIGLSAVALPVPIEYPLELLACIKRSKLAGLELAIGDRQEIIRVWTAVRPQIEAHVPIINISGRINRLGIPTNRILTYIWYLVSDIEADVRLAERLRIEEMAKRAELEFHQSKTRIAGAGQGKQQIVAIRVFKESLEHIMTFQERPPVVVNLSKFIAHLDLTIKILEETRVIYADLKKIQPFYYRGNKQLRDLVRNKAFIEHFFVRMLEGSVEEQDGRRAQAVIALAQACKLLHDYYKSWCEEVLVRSSVVSDPQAAAQFIIMAEKRENRLQIITNEFLNSELTLEALEKAELEKQKEIRRKEFLDVPETKAQIDRSVLAQMYIKAQEMQVAHQRRLTVAIRHNAELRRQREEELRVTVEQYKTTQELVVTERSKLQEELSQLELLVMRAHGDHAAVQEEILRVGQSKTEVDAKELQLQGFFRELECRKKELQQAAEEVRRITPKKFRLTH